ncbi:asparagine synthase-related protein [Natronococcus sp. A-GB1]|uniref:asparagine synthase-related protein n=1 Tax=Natronococcus sp. A-GB1 TaxID=3037648 RepID=UPI00241D8355|nr:asparagine synthase-related protein [Natronococcus sp. A-GB1]MDG5762057.1 asparagine synthase-related protein [Natronococcus sp. A-GB1]
MKAVSGVFDADGSVHKRTIREWVPKNPGVQTSTDHLSLVAGSDDHHPPASVRRAETESVHCWLLGDVYGSETGEFDGGYESRSADVDPARYCLSLYEDEGFEFLDNLNGNYTLLVYDRETQRFTLCTDRFGTVPIYWTRADDGTIVFSTNIQLLPFHPAVDTAYHPAYLHEYLAFRCTFGVKTPLESVEKLEPGTITSIAVDDGSIRTEQYWQPRYRPSNESFEWFVKEFADRFQTVIDEWTQPDKEYGVLLSGGRDSRLILAALDDATAFHMNDWLNREARIALRVAFEAGAEFELLERGPEYRIAALERNRWADSFNGWFSQPYTSGFDSQITSQVDGLLSGLYSDSLFSGYSVPSPTLSLGPLGSITMPIERSIETIDDYIDLLLERAHNELEMPTDLRTILESNIYRDGDRIVHHGVTYDSLETLVYYGSCYPLSNDDDMRFHGDLRRRLPYRSPFLDNRLLELSLSMPPRYRLRRDLIGQSVAHLDPDLAAIPHAGTGVALSRPFPVTYASEHALEFWSKHVLNWTPPEPYLTDGPWLNDAELLRSFEFVTDVLGEHGPLADAFPGPEAAAIRALFREHCQGADRIGELYTLLTVLTMPVTNHLLSDETDSAAGEQLQLQPSIDNF